MDLNFDGNALPETQVLAQLEQAGLLCLSAVHLRQEDVEVSVSFVDAAEMKELNHSYRSKNQVTDVLSFPQFESVDEIPSKGFVLLGDVVICQDQAQDQAEAYGHSYERELVYLFVHSMLHLLGFDHMNPEDKQLMRSKEEEIMAQMGLERR